MKNSENSVTIGLDIGGTNLRVARACNGNIEARAQGSSSGNPTEVLKSCLKLIQEVMTPEVEGIGIGIPGQVDSEEGRVFSGGFVDFSGIDICKEVEHATSKRVVIENDATMALIGEFAYGSAKNCHSAAMITIGTGIGGALMERGRILRGNATAGQLGHIIVDPNGRKCLCGRTGCLETVSSGYALAENIKREKLPESTQIEDLLKRNDPLSKRMIKDWSEPLRMAIDSLIAILNIQRIVIGGGLGKHAVKALERLPESESWFSAPVVPAELGSDAGVIGAAKAAHAIPSSSKNVVLVNGIPASGKSYLSNILSMETGWPVLALDTIKSPFFDGFPQLDRQLNRKLGRASLSAIFNVISDSPAGTTFIVDAWFGSQPKEVLNEGLSAAGVASAAEIWCHAPTELVTERYRKRISERHSGHPGIEYLPELVELASIAEPTGMFPCKEVNTESEVGLSSLIAWLKCALKEFNPSFHG